MSIDQDCTFKPKITSRNPIEGQGMNVKYGTESVFDRMYSQAKLLRDKKKEINDKL
jgi:hypothetical protein